MIPTRIQRGRKAGFKLPPNTVCITRGGHNPFGNPFRIGMLFKIGPGTGHGLTMCWCQCLSDKHNDGSFVKVRDRAHAVEMFREYRHRYPFSEKELATLRAADYLACWCPLSACPNGHKSDQFVEPHNIRKYCEQCRLELFPEPCHGNVIIEILQTNQPNP